MQAKYFKSLPLHYSQEILEETNEYTIFQYFLTPDYDFKQDVLSFGASVEILEPEHLRNEIGEMVTELNRRYNNG
jgi:predicted DNA-binding transcriptional regulator YafY